MFAPTRSFVFHGQIMDDKCATQSRRNQEGEMNYADRA